MLSKAKMAVLLGTMATALSLGAIGSAYAAEEQAAAANNPSQAQDKADFGKMKPGHKKGFGFGVAKENAELLTLLNLDAEKLKEELKAGKTLAEIAEAQGVDKQKVIDLLVKQQEERLAEAVKAGKLTQEQADEMRAKAAERAEQQVNNAHPGGPGQPGGPRGFGKGLGGFGKNEELLTLLNLDEEKLKEELKAGKTLAEIAEAQGVDKQKVIDLLVKQQEERLAEAVKAGKLTQEQADEWKQKHKDFAARIVEGIRGEKDFPPKKAE